MRDVTPQRNESPVVSVRSPAKRRMTFDDDCDDNFSPSRVVLSPRQDRNISRLTPSKQLYGSPTKTAVDDNERVMLLHATHVPGESFPVGISSVEYIFVDDSHNMAFCSFSVIVEEGTDFQYTCIIFYSPPMKNVAEKCYYFFYCFCSQSMCIFILKTN